MQTGPFKSFFFMMGVMLLIAGCALLPAGKRQSRRSAGTERSMIPRAWLPITYLQSAFFTGHDWGAKYRAYDDKVKRARVIGQAFSAAEVLNQNLDTPEGFHDIRDTARAFRTVSQGADRPFLGFWSFPRFPGFFRQADLEAQPESWRSCSLKADGRLWRRYPSAPEDIESLIKFTGETLDITKREAVGQLLANVARAFRQDGPADSSTGPLFGFVVLNEAMLCGNYESVWSKDARRHDVASSTTVMRLNAQTHAQLFTDDDPYYSYYGPPKRAIPLFSESAAASFAAYVREHGYPFDKLPADRNEFMDDDAAVALPGWVQFVPLDQKEYWQVWEDWVFATWTGFVEAVHREISLAQQGNPDYHGAIYFQLPGWYSLRRAAWADEQKTTKTRLTYDYFDGAGQRVTTTEVPQDDPEYSRLNPVTCGVDIVALLRSPWFAGALHETTCSIPLNRQPAASSTDYQAYVERHDRYRHYFLAQGALLRQVCRENNKLFGAFARSQCFGGGEPLTPAAFEQAFERTIVPLKPDIISTIGPWFVNPEKSPATVEDKQKNNVPPALADVWRRMQIEYTRLYHQEKQF